MAKRTKVRAVGQAKQAGGVTHLTRMVLWARAAGRCQYTGCNEPLIGDLISGSEDKNFGFVAHIVAETPTGPRGDPVRSPQLANDINNLMLMCHRHHKLIDVDDVDGHAEMRLVAMKAEHERRIETVTAIDVDRASHVLRYAANIGDHQSPVAYEQISAAMLPSRYPAEGRRTIDIELQRSSWQDHEPDFWRIEGENLRRQFANKVYDRIEAREIRHLSVFALAPQPLLVELGRLLCDIAAADIHQLHREPKGWAWPPNSPGIRYATREPAARPGPPALVLGLSATINDERVERVLGSGAAIWRIDADMPHNDIMKCQTGLAEFRRLVRSMLNAIKARHGESAVIHVFPALPVSAAIEVGRVWMPKADLPLLVYDQNRKVSGFVPALQIGG